MASPYNIAIIGAGPGGCMLARLLYVAGISVTVFEAEAGLDDRIQGGTLDLHDKDGLAAIKRANLYDEFLAEARFDGEAFKYCDKRLINLISLSGNTKSTSRGRPEIDRLKLRQLLLRSLPDGTIRWSHRLRQVDSDGTLHFDHGTERGYHLIVGADGAFSKVRPCVTDIAPYFTGITGLQLSIPNAAEVAPEIYKLVNRGSVFASSDHKNIVSLQLGDGSIWVSANVPRQDPDALKDLTSIDAKRSFLLKEFAGWHPLLLSLFQQPLPKGHDIVSRPLFMLPVGIKWTHHPRFTLIGDAAHLMSPYGGQGVNLCFEDCIKLADSITSASKGKPESQQASADPLDILDKNVRAFETDMFTRAFPNQRQTVVQMNATFFTPGAPWSNVESYILGAMSDQFSRFSLWLIAVIAYSYFFVFRLLYKPKQQ